MEFLGIKLDKKINAVTRGADVTLSTPDAAIKVMTITTDEELVIAMETVRLSY